MEGQGGKQVLDLVKLFVFLEEDVTNQGRTSRPNQKQNLDLSASSFPKVSAHKLETCGFSLSSTRLLSSSMFIYMCTVMYPGVRRLMCTDRLDELSGLLAETSLQINANNTECQQRAEGGTERQSDRAEESDRVTELKGVTELIGVTERQSDRAEESDRATELKGVTKRQSDRATELKGVTERQSNRAEESDRATEVKGVTKRQSDRPEESDRADRKRQSDRAEGSDRATEHRAELKRSDKATEQLRGDELTERQSDRAEESDRATELKGVTERQSDRPEESDRADQSEGTERQSDRATERQSDSATAEGRKIDWRQKRRENRASEEPDLLTELENQRNLSVQMDTGQLRLVQLAFVPSDDDLASTQQHAENTRQIVLETLQRGTRGRSQEDNRHVRTTNWILQFAEHQQKNEHSSETESDGI
ncbi:unnamed protein product [Pleuronectes platessa]|uniref:Uncharacterized protein n=1 Tax=Pleuronectes platessa TaxID=8262 RepID=A0A9N7YAL2_PLEPL|nr:unnamed protein product [Pleuronectes platessa]